MVESGPIEIQLNGERRQVKAATLEGLLEELSLGQRPVATMVNDAIIRREQRAQFSLSPGDRVEIISMVGGG